MISKKQSFFEVAVYCENALKYVYHNVSFCRLAKFVLGNICNKMHVDINAEESVDTEQDYLL
jgi:hypothetical protein